MLSIDCYGYTISITTADSRKVFPKIPTGKSDEFEFYLPINDHYNIIMESQNLIGLDIDRRRVDLKSTPPIGTVDYYPVSDKFRLSRIDRRDDSIIWMPTTTEQITKHNKKIRPHFPVLCCPAQYYTPRRGVVQSDDSLKEVLHPDSIEGPHIVLDTDNHKEASNDKVEDSELIDNSNHIHTGSTDLVKKLTAPIYYEVKGSAEANVEVKGSAEANVEAKGSVDIDLASPDMIDKERQRRIDLDASPSIDDVDIFTKVGPPEQKLIMVNRIIQPLILDKEHTVILNLTTYYEDTENINLLEERAKSVHTHGHDSTCRCYYNVELPKYIHHEDKKYRFENKRTIKLNFIDINKFLFSKQQLFPKDYPTDSIIAMHKLPPTLHVNDILRVSDNIKSEVVFYVNVKVDE